jgi:diguanylate cyclase (GGDEF)-like protein
MVPTHSLLSNNIRLLKAKASRQAAVGAAIAMLAVILASLLSTYVEYRSVSIAHLVQVQANNPALWLLDLSPFAFALWGQFVGTAVAWEAGAMVIDQTEDLRAQTSALEIQVAHDTTHDALTALPNRNLFRDRVEQAIVGARSRREKVGVLIIDLDNFKEVNDTLGHYSGDILLKQLGIRLSGVMQKPATLARLGGDEFGILLPEIESAENIEQLVEKIHRVMKTPFSVNKIPIEAHASIGATLYPDHGEDEDTLIQLADLAMYSAKTASNGYMLYEETLKKSCPHHLSLMGELRRAIEADELVLQFQPKIAALTGKLLGAEALVRWQHREQGLIPPDEFIPLAERTGLIGELSLWVVQAALRQCRSWRGAGLDISVAVNLSSRVLLDPELPEKIIGYLEAFDVPARVLVLEITETSIMADADRAMEILQRLASIGVRISIDDFGTGYSSLAYLKRLPARELKIDEGFVLDMLEDEHNTMIVRTTIVLAHNLGLQVVAEGVASAGIAERLRELDCDILQGYYISEPIAGDALVTWARDRC